MLLALVRAYQDSLHPAIHTDGIEERDLAFEADLLSPAEVEPIMYGNQKRGHILRLLRAMKERGWIDYQQTPYGTYRVVLKAEGERDATELQRSWWSRLRERLGTRSHEKAAGQPPESS